MPVTWIVVADSSRARIFSKNGRTPLREEAGFIHPESRLHEQDLTSDAPYEVMLVPGLNGWSRMTRPTRAR